MFDQSRWIGELSEALVKLAESQTRYEDDLVKIRPPVGRGPWEDIDRVRDLITETIRPRVDDDEAYRNARENSDKENARVEHDRALLRVMTSLMKDDTQLFMDDAGFKRWLTETMFHLTYNESA